MKAVWAITKLTIQEALRNKILYLLLGFALFLIVSSWVIGKLTVGDELKIIKDLCISGIHIFGVLITTFIGISLIFREMEKRTIYLILSKPIPRYQFLVGKFLGLAITLLGVLVVLAAVFFGILALKGEFNKQIWLAFYTIYLEWLIIAGIAILFSSFSTPLLSTMLTFCAFVMGHLTESLLMLKGRLTSAVAGTILTALFYALPNLELFNIRSQMVHSLSLPAAYFFSTTLYWLLYLSSLLMFAAWLFHRKDFV
ncbi:MAG TPA: ABC transporter permease [Acidobacteriota bacterium]|nr:ABC transporter permease [Acidobacteriota bacterium]